MKITAALLSLVACCFLIPTTAGKESGGRRYCGDALTDVLSLACNGVYNYKKRTDKIYHDKSEYEDSDTSDADEAIRELFRGREDAFSMTRHRLFRGKRGVVDECCYQTCTYSELTAYCAKPPENGN